MTTPTPLFTHSATHNTAPGTLTLTHHSLHWKHIDGSSSVSLHWSGVLPGSDKYQPLKGMLRLQLTPSLTHSIDSKDIKDIKKDFKIFTLTEENPTKLAKKFDIFKRFIKHKLYGEPSPLEQQEQWESKAVKRLKRKREGVSDEENRIENILEDNPELSAWYEELVKQGDGVCDSDEFWQSRGDILRDMEIDEKSRIQGMVNSLLSDIDQGEFDSKGVKHIQMNNDSKKEIFLLYPAVKKEFDEQVPAHMTEDVFWGRYFQSQHATQSTINLDGITSLDLAKQQQHKKKIISKAAQPSVYVSPFVTMDVDLTSSAADHYPREALDPDDYKWIASDYITQKYINKSSLIIQQSDHQQDSNKNNIMVGMYRVPSRKRRYPVQFCHDGDSTLLNNISDDQYMIPLKLAAGLSRRTEQDQKFELKMNDAVVRELLQPRQNASSGTSFSSLVFPDNEQALEYLRSDLKAATDSDNLDGPNTVASSTATKITSSGCANDAQVELPDHFDKKLKKEFQLISELLRYFYLATNTYQHVPKNDQDKLLAKRKIDRIQDKLSARIKILMTEKKDLQVKSTDVASSITGKALQNSFRLIKQTSDLVYKAFDDWEAIVPEEKILL